MTWLITLLTTLGGVILYLLSRASDNSSAFAAHYPLLLGMAGLLVLGLMLLLGWQFWVLRRKVRARVFGTKLTLKLLWMFVLVALMPGLLVYGVSVQFLKNSVETWFDVRVDNALDGGLNLGRTALDSVRLDASRKAQQLAIDLADQDAAGQSRMVQRARERDNLYEAALFDAHGELITFASRDAARLQPDTPGPGIIRQVRLQRPYAAIETLPGVGLAARVVVPVNVLSLHEDIRVLQFIEPLPAQLAADAENVEKGYRDYQELSLSRVGIKRIYGISLTFALLLALFSAAALSFVLSERLSEPLGLLTEGTRAVARGNFSRMPVHSRDELGTLMRSFNDMTRQLSEAKEAAESNRAQLEQAKTYLESILVNLTSGVLTFDEQLYLRAANPVAAQILDVRVAGLRGLRLEDWAGAWPHLAAFADTVAAHFAAPGQAQWQAQLDKAGAGGHQVLLVRGSRLPAGNENGFVVVFDDITRLMQAQRDAAWGEVARRLAHEIRNPLTPIQLSAERLEHKLAAKLGDEDRALLTRQTRTIVTQVGIMKGMVDAFREYARLPAVRLSPLDLNHVVRDVLTLYEAGGATVEQELVAAAVPILGDEGGLRQVIHNLLQNAQDAAGEAARVRVATARRDGDAVLAIEDNGPGFPEELLAKIFEPYVTTKPKGTGLGLAIVRKIVEEHHGRVTVENAAAGGARVTVHLPLRTQDNSGPALIQSAQTLQFREDYDPDPGR